MTAHKVLLVDDEASVLKVIQRLLRKEAFDVATTLSAEEALDLIGRESYAVVVADQRMPGMEGTRMLEKARQLSPDTVRIILTGYVDIHAAMEAINRGAVYRFITKPWNDEELCLIIRQAVSRFEMVKENKRLHALTEEQNARLKELNRNLEQKVIERTEKISRLNRQLEERFKGSVQVMANLAEIHSSVIGSHSKRTAMLCQGIATYMELSEEDIFYIELAATLHDIGKIGISAEILGKIETALSQQEIKTIRRHVTQGEAIIRMVPNMGDAPLYIRHHHEHFDGTGYPYRLKGQQIPIGSRIIAVANAYDNVLNKRRLYQTATPEKALRFVQERSGKALDPDVVMAFSDFMQREGRTLNKRMEVEVNLSDIQEGMVLSRDLRTARGILLLPKDSKLEEKHLVRIMNFHDTDPILDSIYIYRRSVASAETLQAERARLAYSAD